MAQKLTHEIIAAAIEGFEAQKTRIDDQINELKAILSGGPAEIAASPEAPTRKRKVSAAARRRMALGQRRRWEKIKGTSEPPAPATPQPPKVKHRISAEGMKRIIAATKKRWRLAKAAKEQSAAKKATPALKKAAVKRAAPVRAVKKSAPVKKAAGKKSATAAAQFATQAVGQ